MVLSEIDRQDRAQAPLGDLPSSGGRCGACSARPSCALLDAARGRDQTTANQERELRAVAERAGWEIVKVYKDHGISGAKGRDKRPAYNAMLRDAFRRQFDVVMAWASIGWAAAYRSW
jgi:hypothetical protein